MASSERASAGKTLVSYDPGKKHNAFLLWDLKTNKPIDAKLMEFTSFQNAYVKMKKFSWLRDAETIVIEEQFPCSILEVRDYSTLVRSLFFDKVVTFRPSAWRRRLKVDKGSYYQNKKSSKEVVEADGELISVLQRADIEREDWAHFGDCVQFIKYWELKCG